MTASELQTDIAIIGGGIAGLWTLNQLRNKGYNAVLFEQESLGSYQTIGSQGMIHGGIKYALGGALSGGSEAISSMPDIWRQCLHGEGKVDLRASTVLSKDFYLWSSSSLQSRLSSFFASKMLRGRVDKLNEDEYPVPFRNPGFRGQVYRLVDLVMDMPSLVKALAEQHREAIFKIDWNKAQLVQRDGTASIELPQMRLQAQRIILTAGTGNEALLAALGSETPAMQRRPLQQVLVKHEYRESLYAHCMGGNASPRLTISSHRTRQDEPVWYLGGDLATEGTDDSPDKLIDKARRELGELLPWVDFGKTEWCTIKLDRAEPRQAGLLRPDQSFVGRSDSLNNVLTAWPTKLTLSPHLADEIEVELARDGIVPKHPTDLAQLALRLGTPEVASPCWDTLFL
ncbi:MAG: FAD-dependent oxidoreductase [Halioglobus sp.]